MQRFIAVIFLFFFLVVANSVYATGVCLRGYGSTPEEAFKIGTKLLSKTVEKSGKAEKELLLENLQIRILPKKKKYYFTVLVYSMDKQTSCDLPVKPQPAETADRPKCTKNICSI
ncbi:MAG: hypothetical protein D3920_09905 [Candidatus Electrothrix sp. AW2]|nr:hypothetical protein [Candidatus Electrothrix gigas]MCI5195923.1 hypothetical protein [Candidatus Electrothrix gigas]